MVAELFAKECDKYFMKGVKKGKKEGKTEGKIEGMQEAIIKMLKLKTNKEFIKSVYEISDEEIENIEKKIV